MKKLAKNISIFLYTYICIMSGDSSQHRFFQGNFLAEGKRNGQHTVHRYGSDTHSHEPYVYLMCSSPYFLGIVILFNYPIFPWPAICMASWDKVFRVTAPIRAGRNTSSVALLSHVFHPTKHPFLANLFFPRCLHHLLQCLYWASVFLYQLGQVQECCSPTLVKAVR